MGRLRGVVSLLVILALVLGLLRLIHLVVPIFYPQVLSGPFSLASFDEVEEYAGFSPLLPFYRPESLGTRPVHITVTRRPEPRVVVFWQAEHFLYLSQERGRMPPVPGFVERQLPGHPGSIRWREGRTRYARVRFGDRWVEVRTDLSDEDMERIVDSLRPYEELL